MKTTVKDLKKAIKEAISEVEGAPNTLSLQRDIADALLPLISSKKRWTTSFEES